MASHAEVTEAVSEEEIEVVVEVSVAAVVDSVVDSSRDPLPLLWKSRLSNTQSREILSLWLTVTECHFWLVKSTRPTSSLWAR